MMFHFLARHALHIFSLSLTYTHLAIQVAVLLNSSYPGQHFVAALSLEQVLAVGCGEAEDVFALGVTVGDVNEAGFDAHLLRLILQL